MRELFAPNTDRCNREKISY